MAGGRGGASAWNPSPQGSGGANSCFQCLENTAEFSHESPACHTQIWISLIKKPQHQPEFCPAVSLAGAWSPSTVLREPKCNTRNLHTGDPIFWNKPGTAPQSTFHSPLGSGGGGICGNQGVQLESHVHFSPFHPPIP